jgi:Family of unknown function (DUF6064)
MPLPLDIPMLPFAPDQFLAVFSAYNLAVWPAQLVAYLLGLGMVWALLRATRRSNEIVGAGLGLMWVWTGVAYHAMFFAQINKAANAFAALFVVQGLLFAHAALVRSDLRFSRENGPRPWLGWALIVYSALIYPLIGVVGHDYPAMPMFGITPCPVTLFSFGVLLLAQGPVPRRLLVIPFVWSLVGGSAAFLLAVPQDWPLLVSGLLVVPWLWRRPAQARRTGPRISRVW